VEKKSNKVRDAIFLITQEKSCPLYNVGEEIKVANFSLSVSTFKPSCLSLAQEVVTIVSSRDSFGGFSKFSGQRSSFNCGGCEGILHFEFKKDKDFATLQMKLLNEAEEKRKKAHLDRFFGVLRSLPLFEPLDDDALSDLTLLLDLKTIPVDKVVIKKGAPGDHLFIVLEGKAVVLAEDGSKIAELQQGEIFGEMSLLSGEPTSSSVQTTAPSKVAMLSIKNFKQIVIKHPVLQLFLFKLLVDRAQEMALKAGNITSGMTGELEEIAMVDLLQLINSSQKTGTISFALDEGKAMVFFRDGQIVYARYLKNRDREAIFALLAERSGHFSYTKGIPKELESQQPIGDFMAMLMEGLQKIDEQSPQALA
jgi:CRP/FNR family transcriptional regulator, cyclic AMP receptor protein